ncbi:MAG TPA: hypothetical protein VJJ26_04360 [Candidatus Babeliales bacterium]|nr:hypothetical protein [Candidatus Babeliales bacterium]
MHYSFFSRMRDILLLCALFFLVKTAFERTISFIHAHKKSIVHELDRNFIDQIYTAQRQLHFLEQHLVHGAEFAIAIADMKNRLAIIEEKYKTNSPGVMLLGPIGSAAIVAKEEKLQRKLLELANDLNKILHVIDNKEHEFQAIETIDIALHNNKKLLQTITA